MAKSTKISQVWDKVPELSTLIFAATQISFQPPIESFCRTRPVMKRLKHIYCTNTASQW